MGSEDRKKTSIPPYVSYKTFSNFIEKLSECMPSRIDRSVMTSFSGAVQAQLLSTLNFLHLINSQGIPSEEFEALVKSTDKERERRLEAIVTQAYPFLFTDNIDLSRATQRHLEEAFAQKGGSSDTIRKCIAFFVSIAKAAGIKISPHVKATRKSSIRNRGKKNSGRKSIRTKPPSFQSNEDSAQPQTSKQTWEQLLLAKFPDFDPAWPDNVKEKWFSGFQELMEKSKEISN